MADQHTEIRGELYNTAPSTSYIDKKGKYRACPTNQPLAAQAEQGLTGAQPIGNHVHPTQISGYCDHLVLGGCPRDSE